ALMLDTLASNTKPMMDNFQTEVSLDASSSFDLDGTIISFKWELDGGRIIEGENNIIAIATFPGVRDYPVTLTVMDNEGATAVAKAVVLVKNNQAPQGRIQITPPTVVVGDDFNTEVTLDARASFDLDGVITSFKWELNGGRIIKGENEAVAKAVFPGIRNYPVTLTVTDNDGATATATDEVVVGRIAIQEVQLVDAQDDDVLGTLKEGDVINLSDFEEGFSLVAITNPPVIGSVVFRLNGESFRAESVPPYTFFGDINSTGDILGGELEPGSYELEVIPFSERGAQGDAGIVTTINFEVVEGIEEVRAFTLINAETNEVVRDIQDGDQINLANYPQGVGILAETFPEEVGSVLFFLNGEQARLENLAPYSLSGDQNGTVNPLDLPVGAYTFCGRIYFQQANDSLSGFYFID
ncbi:MAG: PKD domain-containing protein, partial [Bacteroidota bacterium]